MKQFTQEETTLLANFMLSSASVAALLGMSSANVRYHRWKIKKQPRVAKPTGITYAQWKLFRRAKVAATYNGISFTITADELDWPISCPILDMPLVYINRDKKGQWRGNWATFDRLDSTEGYIPGNVRIISHRANRLKNSASIEEVKRILAYMESSMS